MSADQLIQYVTQALYVLVFVAVAVEAIRRPWRANIDIALFFGVISIVIAEQILITIVNLRNAPVVGALMATLLMALPYLLLRLVDDFASVPKLLMRAAEIGLVGAAVALFLSEPPYPLWLTLVLVIYFFGLTLYASVAFFREGHSAKGVTRRRMYAVGFASAALGLTILLAGVQASAEAAGAPIVASVLTALSRLLSLASAVAYVLGFAPPTILRRAWQEPELRAFLTRAADLPRLPDTRAMIGALEEGTAAAVGSPHATISLFDAEAGGLFAPSLIEPGQAPAVMESGVMIGGQAFARQRSIFSPNAPRDDPAHAEIYREFGARAVLAAPITAGEKRLGVLVVYAPRAPIFAQDDLGLLQLLADQSAVILESRSLIDEALRLRAREEANRLKDDFLSAAAHDLKTPLTTLVAQSQLLERRAAQNPVAPADVNGIRRLVDEAKRLNELVLELLDATRAEQGRLLGRRELIDLGDLVRQACQRERSSRHRCIVEIEEPAQGEYDRTRIRQLLENLLENAVKYSPAGGDIKVRLWLANDEFYLTVADTGIGINRDDLESIFDRFQRGGNVDDRRFAGMGLGLFICRGIVEEHGGRIWVDSAPGRGSTFHVVLPATPSGVSSR